MTTTTLRPILRFRLLATLGVTLGLAGAVLYPDMSSAKPPSSDTDANGNYWCYFDNANGGDRINQGPFNSGKGEPDCGKVCEAHANGTNCNETSTVFVPGTHKAPTAPREREQERRPQ